MIGRRDIIRDPQADLTSRMQYGVTGRQLTVDGSLILQIVDFDPATASATQIWAEGAPVIYVRGSTSEMWVFRRSSGWQQI